MLAAAQWRGLPCTKRVLGSGSFYLCQLSQLLFSCTLQCRSPSLHFPDKETTSGSSGKGWSVATWNWKPHLAPSPVLLLSQFLPFGWKFTASRCVEEFGRRDPQTEGVRCDLSERNPLPAPGFGLASELSVVRRWDRMTCSGPGNGRAIDGL